MWKDFFDGFDDFYFVDAKFERSVVFLMIIEIKLMLSHCSGGCICQYIKIVVQISVDVFYHTFIVQRVI